MDAGILGAEESCAAIAVRNVGILQLQRYLLISVSVFPSSRVILPVSVEEVSSLLLCFRTVNKPVIKAASMSKNWKMQAVFMNPWELLLIHHHFDQIIVLSLRVPIISLVKHFQRC